jgi:hypothetical protein
MVSYVTDTSSSTTCAGGTTGTSASLLGDDASWSTAANGATGGGSTTSCSASLSSLSTRSYNALQDKLDEFDHGTFVEKKNLILVGHNCRYG